MKQVEQRHIPVTVKRTLAESYKGVPDSILEGSGLDVYQFRIYLFLYHQIGNGLINANTVEISYKDISEQTGMSTLKVRGVVQELVDLKLLTFENRSAEHGGNLPNSYTLYYPDHNKGC